MLDKLESHTISVNIGEDSLRYYIKPDNCYAASVTTVLGQTQDPDKAAAIKRWREENYRKAYQELIEQGVLRKEAEILAKRGQNASRDAALLRGDAIHAALEKYAELKQKDPNFNGFDRIFVPEHAAPYWAGLKSFITERIDEFLLVEGFVYSQRGYAGRCDSVVRLVDGNQVLIDYKTSEKARPAHKNHDYFVQLAAYVGAFNWTYRDKMALDDGILLISRPNKQADVEILPKYVMLTYWDEWLRRLDKFHKLIEHDSKGLPINGKYDLSTV
jgi:RecB family exonuclease